MKRRQIILLGTAVIALGGYALRIATTDTLPSAADKLGKALLTSDTDTIWSFVPEDDRSFYKYDKRKFDAFWSEIVAPKVQQFDSYEIVSSSSNGLEVMLRSSRSELKSTRLSWLVSGQLGKYYVPYMVAFSSINAAGVNPKETRTQRYVRLEQYVKWIDENKLRLQELGLARIRRGGAQPNGQTLEQIRAYFVRGIVKYKSEISVASR